MAADVADRPSVFFFFSCLQKALCSSGFDNIILKVKQAICLERLFLKKDLVAVLPTGYGKSLVFQVLPRLIKERDMNTSTVVIVVSPLNALMQDQIAKLQANGVEAAVFGVRTQTDEAGNSVISSSWEGDRQRIIDADYEIIFCHPEAFLSCKEGLKIFQSSTYNSAVKAIVVDEAHCILEWGTDFRPDYGKLGTLAALFPNAPTAALTATATQIDRKEIIKTLCMLSPKQVIGNLDRPNIYYEKVFREGQDTVAYDGILRPVAESLLKLGSDYPLTIIYLTLPWCGRAYKLFETILKENQYHPSGSPHIPENRLFGQYHSPPN